MSDPQKVIKLGPAPATGTIDRLFAVFGDELIPAEDVRLRYYRNMNADTFRGSLGTERIPLPVTTVANSAKATQFINIRHLAAFIDQRAYQADQDLAGRLTPTSQTD